MITLTGENDFLRSQALASLVDKFVSEIGELGLERIDGEEVEFARISEALTSLPFLASKKLVVFKNPGASKDFAEKFELLLENLPETTKLVLVEAKLDKRTSLYKYLKKASDFREFAPLDSSALARFLVDEAKASGGELASSEARYLVERVGNNQQKLASELAKLLAFNPKITRANVESLVAASPQTKIFDLLDAAFAGNQKKVLAIYEEQLKLGEEPQKIIGLLAWQLHLLALAKTASGKPARQIASDAKISSYSAEKSLALARKLELAQIKSYVSDLLALDTQLKSTKVDADEALKNYLLGIGLD